MKSIRYAALLLILTNPTIKTQQLRYLEENQEVFESVPE